MVLISPFGACIILVNIIFSVSAYIAANAETSFFSMAEQCCIPSIPHCLLWVDSLVDSCGLNWDERGRIGLPSTYWSLSTVMGMLALPGALVFGGSSTVFCMMVDTNLHDHLWKFPFFASSASICCFFVCLFVRYFVCLWVVFLTGIRGYHFVVLINISLLVRQNWACKLASNSSGVTGQFSDSKFGYLSVR